MITVSLDNRKVGLQLSAAAAKIKDLSVPLNQAGDDLVDYFGETVFNSQGVESTGAQWRKWSPATLYMRAKHRGYYSLPAEREDRVLVWTGRLHRSFRKIVEQNRLIIDNTTEYFKYHQLSDRKILAITKNVLLIVKTRIEQAIKV